MTSVTEQQSGLTVEQQSRLRSLEDVIERGKQTFLEVGAALLAIREEKLYKPLTFEAYCEKRWGMSRKTAYGYLSAREMSGRPDIVPLPTVEHGEIVSRLPEEHRPKVAELIADKTTREARDIAREYRERNGVGKTFNRHPRLVALAEELAGLEGRWTEDMCIELTPPQAQKQLRQIDKAIAVLAQAKSAVEYRAATPHSWLGR